MWNLVGGDRRASRINGQLSRPVHNRSSQPCLTLSAKHLALHSKTKRQLKTHINKEIASLINELQIKAKSGKKNNNNNNNKHYLLLFMIMGKLGKPCTLSMYAKLVWLVCASASAADNGARHSADFYSMATFKRTSDSVALLKALTRKKQKASAWSTARWAIRCLCTRNNTLDKYLTKYLPLNESDEQNKEVSRGRGWSGIAGNLWPGPSLLSPGGWTEVDLEVKIPQPASHQHDALI